MDDDHMSLKALLSTAISIRRRVLVSRMILQGRTVFFIGEQTRVAGVAEIRAGNLGAIE